MNYLLMERDREELKGCYDSIRLYLMDTCNMLIEKL